MGKLFAGIFLTATLLFGTDVDAIIKKVEEQMRGKTSHAVYTMEIETPRWKRTVEIEGWSKGKETSFMHIDAPKKDRGITFLKLDNEMWQYVPSIERIIKIPPSMMLQSWMGSDFTNDDLVKESSMEDDYHAKLLDETDAAWTVQLVPKEEAAVVWGKIVLTIDKITYVPGREEFYDELGEMVRTMTFADVKQTDDGRYYAGKMTIEPLEEEKKGNKTVLLVDSIEFDKPLDPDLFTKRALRRMSKR